jgi:hypothetical protein
MTASALSSPFSCRFLFFELAIRPPDLDLLTPDPERAANTACRCTRLPAGNWADVIDLSRLRDGDEARLAARE